MVLDSFLVALFSLHLSSGVLWVCHILLSLRFSAIFFNMYWGYSCLLMDVFAGVEKRIAFIMLVFKYSMAVSISSRLHASAHTSELGDHRIRRGKPSLEK